jgi:hypothetical protein
MSDATSSERKLLIGIRAAMVIQAVSLVIIVLTVMLSKQSAILHKPGEQEAEPALAYADLLMTQELYADAAAQYRLVLDSYELPPGKIANIAYKVGEIYLDRLGSASDALSAFLRAENAQPEGPLTKDLSQKKVACLERLKRSGDARRVLEETTLLDPKGADSTPDASAIVAEVGQTKISLRQVERAIEGLPAAQKEKIKTRDDRLAFLRQYVATELAYNAATRKGIDRDPQMVELIRQMEKNVILQKYISEELGDKVTITPTDLQLFYESKKKDYGDKPLSEIQEQVARDYQQVRYQEAMATLFERLSSAEKVILRPENIP